MLQGSYQSKRRKKLKEKSNPELEVQDYHKYDEIITTKVISDQPQLAGAIYVQTSESDV